jgi:hypothetical protein
MTVVGAQGLGISQMELLSNALRAHEHEHFKVYLVCDPRAFVNMTSSLGTMPRLYACKVKPQSVEGTEPNAWFADNDFVNNIIQILRSNKDLRGLDLYNTSFDNVYNVVIIDMCWAMRRSSVQRFGFLNTTFPKDMQNAFLDTALLNKHEESTFQYASTNSQSWFFGAISQEMEHSSLRHLALGNEEQLYLTTDALRRVLGDPSQTSSWKLIALTLYLQEWSVEVETIVCAFIQTNNATCQKMEMKDDESLRLLQSTRRRRTRRRTFLHPLSRSLHRLTNPIEGV